MVSRREPQIGFDPFVFHYNMSRRYPESSPRQSHLALLSRCMLRHQRPINLLRNGTTENILKIVIGSSMQHKKCHHGTRYVLAQEPTSRLAIIQHGNAYIHVIHSRSRRTRQGSFHIAPMDESSPLALRKPSNASILQCRCRFTRPLRGATFLMKT